MWRLLLFLFFSYLFFGQGLANLPINQMAEEVLRQLYEATANYQVEMPGIEIVHTEDKIAGYSHRRNIISIEEKAIGVCRTFGKDSLAAMAFIIGHELAHAYQRNENEHENITNFLAYDKHFHTSVREEKLADIQGAFSAYLAGYDASGFLSALIEEIYRTYDLIGQQLYGYPALEERIQTSNEVELIVDSLIQIFESANYLTALGHYQIAVKYYEYILQFYMGREIFNNLGVLNLHIAINVSGKNVDPFYLPFELDFESRLDKTRAEELTFEEQMIRRAYLNKAMEYFDCVTQYDDSYFPAQLNQLCALLLSEDYMGALSFFDSGKIQYENQDPVEIAKTQLAMAVGHAILGQEDPNHFGKAEKILEELNSNPNQFISRMSGYNFSILKQKPFSIPKNPICNLKRKDNSYTKIDGFSPYRFIRKSCVFLDPNGEVGYYSEKQLNSRVLVAKWREEVMVLQRITNPEMKSIGDLHAGMSVGKLLEQLGDDSYSIVSANRGYFIVSPTCQLIFKINQREEIEEWGKVF